MRAIVQDRFGGPEVLYEADVPRPQPLPTEVLVQVVSAGLNPVDLRTRLGGGVADMMGDPPYILGWDVSGVVEQIGCGVTILEVGDEVFGMPWFPHQAGGFSEYVVGPTRQFARKPTSLTHDEAAAVPVAGLTVWQLLNETAPVSVGQRVLIHSAWDGIGHLAVQLAKHLGAYVIGTATPDKQDWVRALGADEVIEYDAERPAEIVGDIDLVVEPSGDWTGAAGLRLVETLRPGGTIITVPCTSPELRVAASRLNVTARSFLVEPDGRALVEVADLIDKGHLSVWVDEVFPFKQYVDAHERLASGEARGRIVLRVS